MQASNLRCKLFERAGDQGEGDNKLGMVISLDDLACQLEKVGEVTRNQFLLKLQVEGYELTVFPDARAIISGTDNIAEAKTIYAKYIGS